MALPLGDTLGHPGFDDGASLQHVRFSKFPLKIWLTASARIIHACQLKSAGPMESSLECRFPFFLING